MKMKIAQIQMTVPERKEEALSLAEKLILEKTSADTDVVMLPEMFCCPYETSRFFAYAEPDSGRIADWASSLACETGRYLIAGSFPEVEDGRLYNTSLVFDRTGKRIAKHRKVHLFDIDIKGGQHFMESEVLSAGSELTMFDTEFGRLGLCICYDFRFPEMGRLMALAGCRCIFVPAAFNRSTGPLHWELMFRAQAMFNQIFTVGTAPALDRAASYHSWAHSIVCDPWGTVLQQADDVPTVQETVIDLVEADRVREQIPLLRHRRTDLYEIVTK